MNIKKDLIKREFAGEAILVPVGKTVYESKGLFVLNELGNFIWDILPDVETTDDIVKRILEEYDTTEEEATKDTEEFLEKLRTLEII